MPPAGKATGSGAILQVDPAQNNAFKAMNKAWKANGAVRFRAGKYQISGLSDAAINDLVSTFALQAERTSAAGGNEVRKPRIALYRPWQASMDEGWTRWVLEQYGFEYLSLVPADFKGNIVLKDRIDVLLIADEGRGLLDGYQSGQVPPQYEGGIGTDGVRAIDAFVREGGTLVCFNRGGLFAIDQLHLPVKNVLAGLRRNEFFTGGSVLEIEVDPTQPVMSGLPDRASVFVDGSPFDTSTGLRATRWPDIRRLITAAVRLLARRKYLNGKAARSMSSSARVTSCC